MKQLSIILSVLSLTICQFSFAREISGRVHCGNKGIQNVVISDGYTTVKTDKSGKYSIDTDKDARFVFISTPSGYSTPAEDGHTVHYIKIAEKASGYDFALTKKKYNDTRHNIIAIADQQVYDKEDLVPFKAAVNDIAATASGFGNEETIGICCGDITSYDHGLYSDINKTLSESGIIFRNVPGNHDMKVYGRSNDTSTELFEKTYGPAYYSFNVGKVHYVMLNDNFYIGRDYFYIGYIDEKQLKWLESDLSHIEAGNTVFVSMHIPTTLSEKDRKTFSYDDIATSLTNKKALYEILKPYNVHILSGHMHTAENQIIEENLYEHNIPALSGAWWCGSLCTDGTPNGYEVMSIDGNEVSWLYKSVGYDKEMQMRVYKDEFEGYVVANVWNYDPQWKIEYWVNGKKVCDMEQFSGFDPDARAMYADRSKLKHQYVWASETDHLFRAPATGNEDNAEVRATDPFGRTYIEKVGK